jgi:hypothetical protein
VRIVHTAVSQMPNVFCAECCDSICEDEEFYLTPDPSVVQHVQCQRRSFESNVVDAREINYPWDWDKAGTVNC